MKVFFWALIVALGGFLFGFDTAVISGAEKSIQHVWHLTAWEHGFTISIALVGTVFGALLGGWPSDRLGRRTTLFWIAGLYFLSALGAALATHWGVFMAFRFLGGLGVGASSVTAPLYISELAPAESRGRLVALFQFNVVFGILVAYLSNYLLASLGPDAWRWMLGVQVVPAAIFFGLLFLVPRSPRWLLRQGLVAEGVAVLKRIDPDTAQHDARAILHAHKNATLASLWSPKYRRPLMLAGLLAFFNQASGIDAIIYFAPRIFGMAGLGQSSALLSSAGIGLTNFIFTLLAMSIIDRFGRRTLMFIGSIGLILTLALVARAFFSQHLGGLGVPVLLFGYIAFFAFSQGAVLWVFVSEIFPAEVRTQGQVLGSTVHWLTATIIAFVFPYFSEQLGGGVTFTFFAVMMVLQFLFVIFLMPETKGTTLEGEVVLGH
jgi:sugar porter (SP) family MFS transporter